MKARETDSTAASVHKPRWWLRVLLPALIIVAWLTAAAIGGPLFGRIDEVSSNDQSAYLPASAESTRAGVLARDFYDSEDIPALVLIVADNGTLDQTQLDAILRRTPSGRLTTPEEVVPVVRMLLLEHTNINGQSIVTDGAGSI